MNNVKTTALLGLLTGLFMAIGGMFGGRGGMLLALVLAAGMNFVSYFFSDKIVLSMYGAKDLPEAEAPRIHAMTREITQRAGLPMPRLVAFDQDSPNAFATGRSPDHAVVALSSGIMRLMSEEQLKGVIAHELSHVRYRDTLISTVAATLAGAIMFLVSQMRWLAIFGGGNRDDDDHGGVFGLIAMMILAPIAASLIQLAISRSREYKADASAAELTGNPEGLASALEALERQSARVPLAATQATAHLFIVSPLSGKSLMALFSTHPPIAERVARLRAMRLH